MKNTHIFDGGKSIYLDIKLMHLIYYYDILMIVAFI